MNKWDAFFLENSRLVSRLSKDPSAKVGCVIVDNSNNLISSGYNGFPKGIPDKKEWYDDREKKLKYTEHAERNAISQASKQGVSLNKCALYTTHFSCIDCAKGIINSGIKRVVYICNPAFGERWNADEVKDFLEMANVELVSIDKKKLQDTIEEYGFDERV